MLTSESNIEENKNKVKNKNGFFSERKERVFSDNLSKYTYDNINKKKYLYLQLVKNSIHILIMKMVQIVKM